MNIEGLDSLRLSGSVSVVEPELLKKGVLNNALDALTLVSSTYIIIERSHGIDINIRCRTIDGILVQLILRCV